MSQLSLAFLGRPEVRHAGRLIALPTRKALALLVYLAMEEGVHSREKLTALFWPGSNTERGRGMLRTTLAFVRSALHDPAHAEQLAQPARPTARLGHLIINAGVASKYSLVWSGVALLTVTTMALYQAMGAVEAVVLRRYAPEQVTP